MAGARSRRRTERHGLWRHGVWRGGPVALLALAALCGCSGGPPQIIIATPVHGSFHPGGGNVIVSGAVLNIDPAAIADVRVNGVSVMPLTNMTFMTSVALDPVAIINPIVAEVIGNSGSVLRDRITVIAGDSIQDGDYSLDSVALRFSESGLDDLEPFVKSQVPLDLATLVPPGTLIVDNFCYQDSIFGCLGRVDATVSGSPAPSISDFAIDIDPMTDFVAGDITLYDLYIKANVFAVTGIPFSCTIDITSSTTTILGDYGMAPDAGDPSSVDVTQLGGVSVNFGGFADDTNCSGLLGGVVEFFIGLLISDLQNDLVKPGLQNFLNAVDAEGNTPIAGAIETALDGIEIAGPIGEALGVELETPLFDVTEDVDGITLGSDSRILATMPDPNAVDLAESFHVDQAFPTFGTLAPNGQPFDLGMCVSASAFNQLLKAEIESGLLITTISELDFGLGPVPISAGLLASLLPAFGVLDPSDPLLISVYPTMAPFVTGEPGPNGELATLRVPHLGVVIVPLEDTDVRLLEVAVDADLGLEANFSGGELGFTVATPTPQDISFTLIENPLLESEATINTLVPQLLALAVPVLGDSLGTFPIPSFFGLDLTLVDVDRTGEFISVFLNLDPMP